MKMDAQRLLTRIHLRFRRKPVKEWSDGAVLALFAMASIQAAFWGAALLPTVFTPTIELTNAVGFTWVTAAIGSILFVIGANVAFSTLIVTYTGGLLMKRLFEGSDGA